MPALFRTVAAFVLILAGAPQQPTVRFHHVHYRVGDPSAAMSHVASKVGGTRVVVPGMGVGVRAGTEFIIFDRLDESEPSAVPQLPLAEGYGAALSWLARHGILATPSTLADLRVTAGLVEERYDHVAFVTTDLPKVREQLSRGGAAAIRSTEDAVLFDTGGGVRVEIVRDTDRPDAFWCPMHPDVRSADAGSCPLCGMQLVPILPPRLGEYKMDVTQTRKRGVAGLSGLKLTIRDPESNGRVRQFITVHERLLHLFIVGRDLEYFEHVHPDVLEDGSFTLTHQIPPGEYMLIADFLPAGGTTQMVQRALLVAGTATPRQRKPAPEDLQIALKAEDFAAGKYACLTFTMTDARTGAPVTDLQPYLGAPAHMLLVRGDLTEAVHVHPEALAATGPVISFHPLVPAPGDYKMWVQVQRGGRVVTVPFSIRAKE